jgi:hypothetical protein
MNTNIVTQRPAMVDAPPHVLARIMTVLMAAALAGGLLTTDAQARGGGGHGGGGGFGGGFAGGHAAFRGALLAQDKQAGGYSRPIKNVERQGNRSVDPHFLLRIRPLAQVRIVVCPEDQ